MKYPENRLKGLIFSVFVIACMWSIPADESFLPDGFIDSATVRAKINDRWLSGELNTVMGLKPETYTDQLIYTFTVSRTIDSAAGILTISVLSNERNGEQGKWILARRLSDGLPDYIRVWPVADSSIFFTLRPDGENPDSGRTFVDLTIYGADACRGAPIGLPFTRMYTMPLSDSISLVSASVPIDLLSVEPDLYTDMGSAVSVIRSRLNSLVYLDDGCFNEKGAPVHIKDESPQSASELLQVIPSDRSKDGLTGGVNCSGFAKWIVDGIIRPLAGEGLYIEPLKTRTAAPDTEFTRPFRDTDALFFALDWTRNLASAVVSLSSGHTVLPDVSGVDVTADPFAGTDGYLKNVGYHAADLIPLLYYLAVKEPGHFYLGAVNRERGTPPMREYHHVAAFFPYFDQNGKFTVAVFESAVETPIASFIATNSDAFVHLVRVRIPEKGYFAP